MKKVLFSLTIIAVFYAALCSASAATEINLYFPPKWKDMPEAAKKISDGLSQKIGIKVNPRLADCHLEILTAMTQQKPVLAYVGSMAATIISARKLGTPLLQAINNKESYGGIMVVAKGISPAEILKDHPAEIAYTVGTTSGEVCAKAATGGMAEVAVLDHPAAVDAIKNGRAKAAYVKSSWWEANLNNYSGFAAYSIAGVSEYNNVDNVLLVSNFVKPAVKSLIMSAAKKAPNLFNAKRVAPFDSKALGFTRSLMTRAGIDPLTYSWQPINSGQCADKLTDGILMTKSSSSHKGQSFSPGERVLEKKCGKCHLVEKVKQHRRNTREQWEITIIEMGMGGDLTKKEHEDLIRYLLSLKKEEELK